MLSCLVGPPGLDEHPQYISLAAQISLEWQEDIVWAGMIICRRTGLQLTYA